MKILFSILFLFPALSQAMSITDIRLVRMLDGRAYNCREKYEAGKTAYFPEVKSVSADDLGVSFAFDVSFVLCVGGGERLSWQARRPLDPVLLKDMDGNPMRLEFSQPDFSFGAEGNGQAMSVPAVNEPRQKIEFVASIDKLLSPTQLRNLFAGKIVQARLLMVGRSIVTSISERGTTLLGRQPGQSYTLFFTLKK